MSLKFTTLLCAAANAGAEELPRNSGGRGAATPAGETKSSAGPISLDSPDLACGKPVNFAFADGQLAIGIKDPIYGYMDHNGVAYPQDRQPTGWHPLPE